MRKQAKKNTPICAVCGKVMHKFYPEQTMHYACEDKKLLRERQRLKKQEKREIVEQEHLLRLSQKKNPPKPPKYSIGQCDQKARELGMTYGKYVLLLSQGKVEPPGER